MGLSDFPNGVNELSIGVNVAKSTAHFINGLTVPFNCFDYKYNDALMDPLLTTFTSILNPTLSFIVSMVAIVISSELRGVYDVPGLDAFPNSYLELCKRYCSHRTPSGSYPPAYYESGFAKANVKIMQDSFITAGMYAFIPNAVACLTRMGLFATNKAGRLARSEQRHIRKPLYKPNYKETTANKP